MYFNGRGTTPDMQQAFYWTKKAAEQGHFLAQNQQKDFWKSSNNFVGNWIFR